MSDALPITPEQIAEQAIAAAKAGAAILHLHARDPSDGRSSADPELFLRFIPALNDATDAVVNITTGGSLTMSVEDRLATPLRLSPEKCSLNMGSMNFGFFAIADKQTHCRPRHHRGRRPTGALAVLHNSKLAGCSSGLLCQASSSDYVPRKVGLRFSKNAVTPSL